MLVGLQWRLNNSYWKAAVSRKTRGQLCLLISPSTWSDSVSTNRWIAGCISQWEETFSECHLPVTVHIRGRPKEQVCSLLACPLDVLDSSFIAFRIYLLCCCFSLVTLELRFLIPMWSEEIKIGSTYRMRTDLQFCRVRHPWLDYTEQQPGLSHTAYSEDQIYSLQYIICNIICNYIFINILCSIAL